MPESNYGQIKNINAREKLTPAWDRRNTSHSALKQIYIYIFPPIWGGNSILHCLEKAESLMPAVSAAKPTDTAIPMLIFTLVTELDSRVQAV